MQLEDHVGDIIRKARQAVDGSKEEAAKAAGLSVVELEQLEENGTVSKKADFIALGRLIQLNGEKLERVAEGWLPENIETATWREVLMITTTRRFIVNCFLVWDEVTREAALFDTSAKSAPPEQRNRANDFIHLGNLRITNRETPGHAEDGVTYVIGNFPEDAPNVAIVGDCIFAGSIGRGFISTDLLKEKILEQIFSLPDDTLVCPGHGPFTTVGLEKENNPFF